MACEGSKIVPLGCSREYYEIQSFRRLRTAEEARETLLRHFPHLEGTTGGRWFLRVYAITDRVYGYRVTQAVEVCAGEADEEEARVGACAGRER